MRKTVVVVALAAAALVAMESPRARADTTCLGRADLAQVTSGPPQAEARTYQPINGTGGFSVFGANTLARRGFSAGLGYMGEEAVCQDQDGDFDLHTLWLAVGYGITDRLQVGADFPYSWFTADKDQFDGNGIDDLNLGAVYRLVDEAPGRLGLAIVGFAAAPTGKREEGLGRNAWDVGAKLAATKTLREGLISHLNAGYTYVGSGSVDENDQFTAGAALEWPLNRHFSLVGEGLASTNRRPASERASSIVAEARGGFRVRAAGFLLSLAGRAGLTNDAPNWGVFALLTYGFEPTRAPAAPTTPGAPVGPAAPPRAPAAPAAPGPAAPPAAPAAPGPVTPGAPPEVAAVPPAALPPPMRSVLRDIHFEFDRYDLTREARRTLEDLAQALEANPSFDLLIEGHADERGTTEYNLALGARRAQTAKDYLVSLGIVDTRISTISYGEERPLDTGRNELAWALNRRAHFVVRSGQ